MHLSSWLPWLVVANTVLGHPTALVARSSDDGMRTNEGADGGGIGGIVTGIGTNPGTYLGLGVGYLAAKYPTIERWVKTPPWYRLALRYIRQTPQQREADGHRFLRQIRFTALERRLIDLCKTERFQTLTDAQRGRTLDPPVLASLEDRVDADCRLDAMVRKLNWYEDVQAKRREARAAASAQRSKGSERSKGNNNPFRLTEVKLPSPNLAAMGATLSQAVARVAAQPKFVPVP